MYNPNKIYDLLRERGLKHKDLLEYLGKTWNGSAKTIVSGNIKVDKLESIADFFGVSIDTFFDRTTAIPSAYDVDGVLINGTGHKLRNVQVRNVNEAQAYQTLLEEKDKRIETLQEMVALLKQNLAMYQGKNCQTEAGQQ